MTKRKYRSVAFLVELLVNILVFSIACAVLAGLFGKAGELSRKTREENFASAEMFSLVETLRACGPEALDGELQPDGSLLYGYDGNWRPVGAGEAAYIVRLQITPEQTGGGVLNHVAAAARRENGEEICRMATAVYAPQPGEVPA